MKVEPANDADPKNLEPGPKGSFVGPLLATMTSAITVLGAILLSLQGQAQNVQPIARASEGTFASIDVIPTAPIATVPPDNLFPTEPLSGTVEPVPDQTPGLAPEISITPTALETTLASRTPVETTVSLPTSTPRLCGGVPLFWKLYVVQRGDTLFSLARRHRTSVDLVTFYNCLPGTKIWAGQRLYLPPLPTPVPSATATATAVPSLTPTTAPPPPPPSPIPTLPPTPLPSATATATSRPIPSPIMTATATVAVTASPTLSPTATATGTPTATPILTPTATASPTISATPGVTPTPSASATATPSPTSTPSPSPTPTGTPATSPSP